MGFNAFARPGSFLENSNNMENHYIHLSDSISNFLAHNMNTSQNLGLSQNVAFGQDSLQLDNSHPIIDLFPKKWHYLIFVTLCKSDLNVRWEIVCCASRKRRQTEILRPDDSHYPQLHHDKELSYWPSCISNLYVGVIHSTTVPTDGIRPSSSDL